MALNLELKVKLESFENVKAKLKLHNAEFSDLLNQKDTYYSVKKGLLKLRRVNGRYELIKYIRNEGKGERWSQYSVLNISDKEVENYFDDILEIECIVEKERELFVYKNTRIHLDTVEDLGNFLELETVVKTISQEEAKNEFDEVVNFLGLEEFIEIKGSYRDLMLGNKKAT